MLRSSLYASPHVCLPSPTNHPLKADLNAPETIAPVLKGAYGVFSVTNFLEKMDAAPEITQGKAVADAAKAEGVQHLVWSSLLNVTKREWIYASIPTQV